MLCKQRASSRQPCLRGGKHPSSQNLFGTFQPLLLLLFAVPIPGKMKTAVFFTVLVLLAGKTSGVS
jgi:hypothetical protein